MGLGAIRAASLGRTVYQSEIAIPEGFTTDTWPGCLFAAKLGFVLEHVEDHLVVPLPFQQQVEVEPSTATS